MDSKSICTVGYTEPQLFTRSHVFFELTGVRRCRGFSCAAEVPGGAYEYALLNFESDPCRGEYKDMNPHEVFNSLLDKGIYLASDRTFYRILKRNNALSHRSESKGGTSKHKPDELAATAKNQVWIAKELFEAACLKEKAHPKFVHSDNGEPMKGITLVAFYYQLGIIPSFSRPRVSDDNPYIESFFKGVKHICGYPSCFRTIDGARR